MDQANRPRGLCFMRSSTSLWVVLLIVNVGDIIGDAMLRCVRRKKLIILFKIMSEALLPLGMFCARYSLLVLILIDFSQK